MPTRNATTLHSHRSATHARKTFALMLVLTTTTLAAGLQTNGAWVKLTSEEGRFSVLMPGPEAPKENVETKLDARVGAYTAHRFMKKTDRGAFLIRWHGYAPNVMLDAQGELAANRDNFIKGVNAKVTSESAVTLDANPGIEFTAENTEATFKSRVYVVGQRAYMLVAFTPRGLDDAENVNKFLSSFELKKPAE